MLDRLRPWATSLAVLMLGLVLTAGLVARRVDDNRALLQKRFDAEAAVLLADVKRSTDAMGKGLRGTRAYFQGTGPDGFTQQGFLAYLASRDVPREFPGLVALGFQRRVAASELPQFLARVRRDQGSDFTLHPSRPDAAEHMVLQVASDPVRYRTSLGLDSLADPRRAQGVLGTMRSGQPHASAPIPGSDPRLQLPSQSVVVLYLAMYRDGPRPASDEAAVAQAVGVVSGLVEVDSVVALALAKHPGLLLSIDEQGADGSTLAVRDGGSNPAASASQASPLSSIAATVVTNKVFERDWRFSVQPKAAWFAGQNLPSPALVGVAGCLGSGLLALLAYLGLAHRGRAALEAVARQRMLELEEARHDLQLVMDAVPTLIAYYDGLGVNRFANRAYHEWFDRPLGSIPGLHLREVLGEEVYQKFAPQLSNVMAGHDEHCTRAMTARDGSVREVFAHYMPDRGPDGSVRGTYVVAHDLSEVTRSRDQLAAATRENQALLATLNTHALVSVTDPQGRITDVNPSFCALSGYSREELLGRDHRIVNSGTHPADFWAGMWQTVSAGQPWRAEVCNRAKSGALYWVDSVIAPFFDELGRVERYISIRTDITLAKASQLLVAESEARFRALTEHAPLGVFATNAQGAITYTNARWQSIFGLTAQQGLGDGWQRVVHSDGRAELLRAWSRCLADGERCELRFAVCKPHGIVRQVHLMAQPLLGQDGRPAGFVGTVQDITEDEAATTALREAQASAERANRAKSAFLANMSHEIRTPLNAIVGLSYLLAQKPLATEDAELVSGMTVASEALLEIITDVLDISKIEAGDLRLESAAFQPAAVLSGVVNMLVRQARSKGLSLETECDEGARLQVMGDAARFGQVLSNLLSNAIKFTPSGTVTVRLHTERQAEARTRLRLEVQDSGIGMTAEVQKELFRPFMQADESVTRRFGGTGLGLSIVRQLVLMMEGHIEVDSAEGQGSRFSVTVTLPDAPEAHRPSLTTPNEAVQLMLVDPDFGQRALTGLLAEELGWSVSTVDSGEAMLDNICERHQRGLRTDALVVDWAMPGMDGLTALARLRAALPETEAARTPAVVVVGMADLAAAQQSPHADLVANFLIKPFDRSGLFNAVSEAVWNDPQKHERLSIAAPQFAPKAEWLFGARVMVVDDSWLNLDFAGRLLALEGAAVTRCSDANQALQLLRQNPGGYDAVLMDLQMPSLDGFEAARRIRGELGLSQLPVIALTAGAVTSERDKALAVGMNDFLPKPLVPQHLVHCLRVQIARAQGRPLPIRSRERSMTVDLAPWPQIAGIDGRDVAKRLRGNAELFKGMLRRLLLDFSDLAGTAVPPADWQLGVGNARAELAARAHKLAGSADIVGARGIAQQAARLEATLRAGPASQSSFDAADLAPLSEALRALAVAAQPVLSDVAADAPDPFAADRTEPLDLLDRETLHELADQLQRQQLDAATRCRELAISLRSILSRERFNDLLTAMDEFDFALAAQVVREAAEQVGSAEAQAAADLPT